MSYAGCPSPSPAISAQIYSQNVCRSRKSQKNSLKPPILEVQGHSTRSSTLTPIKSLSLLLVMISSMSVPICNRFDSTRDNWGKITTFRRVAVWRPPAPASLNLGGRDLNCQNLRWMLKISYAGCLGLSLAISSQFSVEMCAASKNCGKNSLPPKRGGEFSVVQTHRCW